jgi:hypothetical protein
MKKFTEGILEAATAALAHLDQRIENGTAGGKQEVIAIRQSLKELFERLANESSQSNC